MFKKFSQMGGSRVWGGVPGIFIRKRQSYYKNALLFLLQFVTCYQYHSIRSLFHVYPFFKFFITCYIVYIHLQKTEGYSCRIEHLCRLQRAHATPRSSVWALPAIDSFHLIELPLLKDLNALEIAKNYLQLRMSK